MLRVAEKIKVFLYILSLPVGKTETQSPQIISRVIETYRGFKSKIYEKVQ